MIEPLQYFDEFLGLGRLLYLDPGSGSIIFQLLIAGLVGAGFIIRAYWKKISGIFRKGQSEGEESLSDEDQ